MTFPNRLSLVLAVSAALFIAGCSVQPTDSTSSISSADPMQQVTGLLQQADTSAPIKAAQLKAEAARILVRLNRRSEAASLLEEVDLQLLPPALQFEIAELKALAALERQDGQTALRYLQQLPPETTNTLPTERRYQIGEMQADAYLYQQDRLSELQQLIQLSSFDLPDKAQALHNRIWNILSAMPQAQLQQLSQQPANNYYEQGWYELALSSSGTPDLSRQSTQLEQWRILWQSHPAQEVPPESLSALANAETITANHIGLLLPMSGNLQKPAEAIMAGFMTAHYNAVRSGATTAQVSVLDSTLINTPEQLYQVAQEKGIDLIIGPLKKEMVASLINFGPAPIPTLTFNTIPESQQGNIYQFGLAIEDEAIQAARQAWQDQHKQALIYTPDTEWGKRAAIAFTKEFTQLGGIILDSYSYGRDANYSEQISILLGTELSAQRRTNLSQVLGERPDFEERRRQDVDAIFLSALPQAARQIKPTLAFHYAGRVPVYATSHIYSGSASAIEDQDLNGIRFVATPWLSAEPSSAHLQLAQLKDNTDSRFGRLYALGADAFQLFPYLAQLAAAPTAEINGETGILSINQKNQVTRTLNWNIFKQGTIHPLK